MRGRPVPARTLDPRPDPHHGRPDGRRVLGPARGLPGRTPPVARARGDARRPHQRRRRVAPPAHAAVRGAGRRPGRPRRAAVVVRRPERCVRLVRLRPAEQHRRLVPGSTVDNPLARGGRGAAVDGDDPRTRRARCQGPARTRVDEGARDRGNGAGGAALGPARQSSVPVGPHGDRRDRGRPGHAVRRAHAHGSDRRGRRARPRSGARACRCLPRPGADDDLGRAARRRERLHRVEPGPDPACLARSAPVLRRTGRGGGTDGHPLDPDRSVAPACSSSATARRRPCSRRDELGRVRPSPRGGPSSGRRA